MPMHQKHELLKECVSFMKVLFENAGLRGERAKDGHPRTTNNPLVKAPTWHTGMS